MLQERTVVLFSTMTNYEPGREAMRAILKELARREATREPMPTLRQLGEATGKSWRQARRYLYELREAKAIDWTPQRGRAGTRVSLTDCGRVTAELIEDL